jgi:TetR/AcrR family transcriptional repressor of nem operon
MEKISAKQKILLAARSLIREKGYSATTVDDLCEAAKVTKGAFFHHFESKEALAVAAADFWTETNTVFFGEAPYHKLADPLDQLLGYIAFRRALIRGEVPEFTCLVGTMVQETYDTNPEIRDACKRSIFDHAASVEDMIREAKKLHAPKASWSPKSLALHTQAVIQGSFVLAKAGQDPGLAIDGIDHLRRYVELLFKKTR